MRWREPSEDRTILPGLHAGAAISALSGPPFFPEVLKVIAIKNYPNMLGPYRRGVSSKLSHHLREIRVRSSYKNQENFNDDGVSNLAFQLAAGEHFPPQRELRFSHRALLMQVDKETSQRLPSNFVFLPQLQESVVNAKLKHQLKLPVGNARRGLIDQAPYRVLETAVD